MVATLTTIRKKVRTISKNVTSLKKAIAGKKCKCKRRRRKSTRRRRRRCCRCTCK